MNVSLILSEILFENKMNVPDGFYITFMDLLKKQYFTGNNETEIFNYINSQTDKVDKSLLIQFYKVLLDHVNSKKGSTPLKLMPYDDLIIDLFIILSALGIYIASFKF